MERKVGTVVRGIRGPIVKQDDDLANIVVNSVLEAAEAEGFEIRNQDIIAVTESILARAQGNIASFDDIAEDVQEKFPSAKVGLVFPILSRNRFSHILHGVSRGVDEVIIQLSYPADEVGNHLVSYDDLDDKGINPWGDVLTEEEFYQTFGEPKHEFTGVNYVQMYREIVESEGKKCTIIFANHPHAILDYTKDILACDVHTRKRTQRKLKEKGAETVYGLDDLLTQAKRPGSGYNPEYGLLGANVSSIEQEKIKLFPRQSQAFVENLQQIMLEKTGKAVEAMVYGDGAFKDPVGKIWELADPVVSPGYTKGLEGTPNEIKLKYLADDKLADLEGEALDQAIAEAIKANQTAAPDESDKAASLGTTPRQLTDLIGSLADLTSGSGDKGTPFVYIQGYFDKLTD